MREWLARLRDWFRRDQLDRELTDELRFHTEQLEKQALADGAAPDAAAQAARRRLGNVTQSREAARERWSWPWLDQLQQDLRYAVRGIRRSPGFAATVIITLGLGIGANAAMFGVIDRLMFRPFPYLTNPREVHRVYVQNTDRGKTFTAGNGLEYTRYLDFRKWTSSFSQMAAFTARTLAVGVGEGTKERSVGVISSSLFDFFTIRPVAGRFFTAAEDSTPRGASVVVLTYGFWQSQFGGRPDVIGQTLRVRNLLCVIIGVTPPGFIGVADEQPPELFIPITTYAGAEAGKDDVSTYYTRYNWGWMSVMARRKPGVSVAMATADLTQASVKSWNVMRQQETGYPPVESARPRGIAGSLKSAAGPDPGLESKTLLWVTGVAAIVLLIACANVANLMLARVLRRRRETAVRLALGVSRGRLVRQSLTESLLLAALGCAAGLLIAQWGSAALGHLFIKDGSLEVLTDWRTLGVAAGFALVAGTLVGIWPALAASRDDLAGSLKAGSREGTYVRSRTRTGLLVLQGALSVVLLVGAGLFVRSLTRVRALRLGFDPEQVVMIGPNLRGQKLTDPEQIALGERLLTATQNLPGVEHAARIHSIPFWSTSSTDLHVPGIDSVRRLGRFTYQTASADYFLTMGTRIIRGRAFGPADRDGTPKVAVVSEAMAAILWPGRDALGQCMKVGADSMPCTAVIGIAENAFQNSLTDDKRFHYYLPIDQYERANAIGLLAKVRGNPATVGESLRRALQRVMPGDGYITVDPMAEVVDNKRRSWQVGATMFVAFGALALLVAAVGLYGVITYNVAQRMHELGVRTALGARSGDLVRLVVGQGIRFVAAGVAIGILVALGAAQWIQPLLFEQSARDPVTYGAVAALLGVVAVLASAAPARRATRADPNTALRAD